MQSTGLFSAKFTSTLSTQHPVIDNGVAFHKKQSLELLDNVLLAIIKGDGQAIKEVYNSYENELSVVLYLIADEPNIEEAKYYAALCRPPIEAQYIHEMKDSGYRPILRYFKLAQTGSNLPIENPQVFLNTLHDIKHRASLRRIGESAGGLGANPEYVAGFMKILENGPVRRLSFIDASEDVFSSLNETRRDFPEK